jgi:hypothetical protein
VRAGLLRIRYWAIDSETGSRAELIAEATQRGDGGYDSVFSTDPRAIDAVLEMNSGDRWLAVRTRRVPAGAARVLPTGTEI